MVRGRNFQSQIFPVDANHPLSFRNKRRLQLVRICPEGIACVDVFGLIETLQLPASGHRDCFGLWQRPKLFRGLCIGISTGNQRKIPDSIQTVFFRSGKSVKPIGHSSDCVRPDIHSSSPSCRAFRGHFIPAFGHVAYGNRWV